jgi:TonB family C-terminal domain
MTKTDLPKNEVEQTLDEAKKNGDKVLTVCLEDCDNSNDLITSGIEVGHVVELPQPEYPALAARAHVSGQVQVQVVIGLEGDVIAAHAIAGHPLLQASAVSAARKARFTPTLLEGKPVKVAGVIAYNFIR